MRVLVTKVDNEADVNLIVLKVVDERPAARIAVQRPAHRVGDGALAVLGGVDLPNLFHAKAVFLRLFALIQTVFRNDLLAQAAAHAFGEEDIFAVQLHARLIAWAGGAIGLTTHLTGNNAFDFAIFAEHKFRAGHTGENFDAQFLGLFGHPTADIAHGDNVVAVVFHQRGHGEFGDAQLARLAQQIEVVFFHRHVDRRAFFFPIGDQRIQPAGVKHRTREDMRAHFGALLQHHDIAIGIQLLEPDRSRQASRPGADDHNVIFHRFAFNLGHFWCSLTANSVWIWLNHRRAQCNRDPAFIAQNVVAAT